MEQYVLVLTKQSDTTADFVVKRMEGRGIPVVRVNTDTLGSEVSLSVQFGSKDSATIIVGGKEITPNLIRKVWLRRPTTPSLQNILDVEARQFAEQEFEFLFKWFIGYLTCPFLDREENILRARNKFNQLRIARGLGFTIPETLITHNPENARQFVESFGSVIAKSIGGFGIRRADGFEGVYTIEMTSEKLEHLGAISLAPVCLQEKIEKRFELRVTIVGEKVFTCRIDSQVSEKTRLDWRRYDIPNTPHSIFVLDLRTKRALLDMMENFGIRFASFDLIVTPKDEIVFLEMNPNSQWVWIEELTGLPITDALIDELVS